MQGKERSERKAASEAYYGFLAENEEELDRIYDELVKVRTKIAKSLGFKTLLNSDMQECTVQIIMRRWWRIIVSKCLIISFQLQRN